MSYNKLSINIYGLRNFYPIVNNLRTSTAQSRISSCDKKHTEL